MIAGCYVLHLYCDNPAAHPSEYERNTPAEYTADTGGACRRQAQRHGWKFTRDDRVLCPRCSGKRKPERITP